MAFIKQFLSMYIHFDYRTIYHQKVSKTFLSMFSFFFVLYLLFSANLYFDFNTGFNEFENTMRNSPYFTIKNGELSFDAPQPYYPVPEDKNIIIDTTGQTQPSALDNKPNSLLITKTKMYSRSNYETRSFDLKLINEVSNLSNVTRNDVTSWIMNFKMPLYIVVIIVLLLYQIIAKIIAVLFLSLILLGASNIMKKNMEYHILFNLSAYAFIFPIILYWLKSIVGVYLPFFTLFYWIFAIIYGYIGVKKYTHFLEPEIVEPQN